MNWVHMLMTVHEVYLACNKCCDEDRATTSCFTTRLIERYSEEAHVKNPFKAYQLRQRKLKGKGKTYKLIT